MSHLKRVSGISLRPVVGFRAQLSGVDLPSLLQMTCARGERAVLCVRSGMREGFIYVDERRVVHAILGFVTGEPALTAMLSFGGGEFSLCEREWPTHYSIDESLESILIRAAQAQDERERAPQQAQAELAPVKELKRTPSSSPPSGLREAASGGAASSSSLLASVRINVDGEVVSHSGSAETLAPLVAYVTRMGALLATQLGLRGFEALSADLGGQKALIFVEGHEMVGLLLSSGSMFTEVRQQLGV